MGTQVLAGSKGHYKPLHDPLNFGNTEFTVMEDTCLEANTVPIKFTDGIVISKTEMKQVVFNKDAQYRDY